MKAGRAVEFEGASQLEDAANKILDKDIDIVVVRGLVAQKKLQEDIETYKEYSKIVPTLYEEIPELRQVNRIVSDYWAQEGYRDYRLTELMPTFFNQNEGLLEPHADFVGSCDEIPGPITLSFCIEGSGTYYAEKPQQTFKKANNDYDYEFSYRYLSKNIPTELRSELSQEQGDLVMITNHPTPTIHSVMAHEGRLAAIFDYMAVAVAA